MNINYCTYKRQSLFYHYIFIQSTFLYFCLFIYFIFSGVRTNRSDQYKLVNMLYLCILHLPFHPAHLLPAHLCRCRVVTSRTRAQNVTWPLPDVTYSPAVIVVSDTNQLVAKDSLAMQTYFLRGCHAQSWRPLADSLRSDVLVF